MSWDYNFFSPEDNVYTPQSPNDDIKYIVCTIAVKWWDRYTYDDIIKKVTKLCTNHILASNQFLLKKNINQAKIGSPNSKQEFRKHLLKMLSQLSDYEDEGKSVLLGYSHDPYDDIELWPIELSLIGIIFSTKSWQTRIILSRR
jgi:hypothetical protein